MTPAARLAAAIEILDSVLSGESAERVLTNWARANRFAGAKDRAAVRDHVFDAVRCLRSYAWLGGAGTQRPTGRQLILGALKAQGGDPDTLFGQARYAPSALTEEERAAAPALSDAPPPVQYDCQDWMLEAYTDSLGDAVPETLNKMRRRSPVFLRVNRRKATVSYAIDALAEDGIEARPHPLSETALEVTQKHRAVGRSQAYLTGLVELQDAGSQAITDMLPLADGMRVLDYCAGGGGKSLAMGARADLEIDAYDLDFGRMQDIAPRASRAGITIRPLHGGEIGSDYDLVLCDAPCSGSGAFARSPQGKWALTPARLCELQDIQSDILDRAAGLVRQGGTLAYATCSLLDAENAGQVAGFLARNPAFEEVRARTVSPLEGGDGFYMSLLKKAS